MALAQQETDELFNQILKQTQAQRPELSSADQLAVAQNIYMQKKNAGATAPQVSELQQGMNAPAPQDGMSAVQMFQNYQNNPQRLAAEKAEAERVTQAIEEQKGFASDAQKLLEQYQSQPTKMNLAPLLALSESWTGFKQGGYQPPPTEEQKLTRVAELQEGLRKAKGGVTQSELEQLRQMSAGADKDAQMLLQAMGLDKAAKEAQHDKTKPDGMSYKDRETFRANWAKNEGLAIEGVGQVSSSAQDLLNRIKNGYLSLADAKVKADVATLLVAYNSNVANLGALAGEDINILRGVSGLQGSALQQAIYDRLIADKAGVDTKEALEKIVEKADSRVEFYARTASPIVSDLLEGSLKKYSNYKQGSRVGPEGKNPLPTASEIDAMPEAQLKQLDADIKAGVYK